MQGEKLAERFGWRRLSTGELLREAKDPAITAIMQKGELVPHDVFECVMGEAILGAKDIERIILDGFPRSMEQAEWLVKSRPEHGRAVGSLIVLDVSKEELLSRLSLRGRVDDTPEAIDQRFAVYEHESRPVIEYFAQQGIPVIHVNGEGTIDEVHERVVEELTKRGFVK